MALALIALVNCCAVERKGDWPDKSLFKPLSGGAGRIEQAQSPRIVRYRFVSVEFDLLSAPVPVEKNASRRRIVILNLFDDSSFNAVLDRREARSNKSYTWFGRIEGVENSQVTLVVEDGVLVGNINVRDAMYQIRYAGKNVHVVYQIDPRTFPADSEPLIPGGR
jgi:hypothetical protein